MLKKAQTGMEYALLVAFVVLMVTLVAYFIKTRVIAP
ncbi:MAG: class III signal peptide-containing protein [Candidatus Micrarchaeota archaeon]